MNLEYLRNIVSVFFFLHPIFFNFSGMDANNPASQAAFSQLMQQMVTNMAGQGQNSPPEERFRVQLETLTSMGFVDRQANIQGNFFLNTILRIFYTEYCKIFKDMFSSIWSTNLVHEFCSNILFVTSIHQSTILLSKKFISLYIFLH